jgi:hypothetical protein
MNEQDRQDVLWELVNGLLWLLIVFTARLCDL